MSGDASDLDGRVFDLVSSTASLVDPDAPTRFRNHEVAGVMRAGSVGVTLSEGRAG